MFTLIPYSKHIDRYSSAVMIGADSSKFFVQSRSVVERFRDDIQAWQHEMNVIVKMLVGHQIAQRDLREVLEYVPNFWMFSHKAEA